MFEVIVFKTELRRNPETGRLTTFADSDRILQSMHDTFEGAEDRAHAAVNTAIRFFGDREGIAYRVTVQRVENFDGNLLKTVVKQFDACGSVEAGRVAR